MSDLSLDYYAKLCEDECCFGEDDDSVSDEEEDERHRPRKMNSRKSLAPLFIYQILKTYSSPEKHLTHAGIIRILRECPYEVKIERKAVGRALHLLADSGIGIISTSKDGAWYDRCACW